MIDATPDPARVRAMFGRIAGRYDLMNRLMTLGRDRSWRRAAAQAVAPTPGGRALDLGCGTGDLTLELAGRGPRPASSSVRSPVPQPRSSARPPGVGATA